MSNWLTITTNDLNDAKVSALVDALRNVALAAGQTDPSPRVIQSVITRIRAEVKGCAKNLLDADTTKIPADLKDLAARMILRQLKSRLEIPLTDDELTEQKNDLRYLERIAACDIPIDQPDNPVEGETQVVSGTPMIQEKRHRFSSRHQEGL